jgi:hypothetical protein
MSKEERFETRQWDDAVRDLKHAYSQFSKYDWKADEGEPVRAARHLRKALNDFDAAMNHVAKADVGEAQKGAVGDVNHGIKELNQAVTELDNGNVDSAQSYYNKAATSFQKAATILD